MQDEMNDLQYTKEEDPDIVRVVRCKNCVKNPKEAWFSCPMAGSWKRNSNDFCSYGERKDGMDS